MDKQEAIQLLGGTPAAAAKEVGVTTAAISLWPDVLPPRISDRVQAALWRRSQRAAEDAPSPTTEAGQGA
jgi:hypothetical protein